MRLIDGEGGGESEGFSSQWEEKLRRWQSSIVLILSAMKHSGFLSSHPDVTS